MASRAMLGVGESFNWPCALRVTSAVLPSSDRSLGNGIFNSGAAVGAVLTPLAVTKLLEWYGWRPVFVLVGSLGLLWVIAWVVLLRGGDRSVFAGRSSSREFRDEADTSPRPSMRLITRFLFGLVVVISLGLVALAGRYGARAIWWGAAVLMVGFPLMALVLPMRWLRGSAWAETLGEVVRLRRFWVLVVVSTSINLCWHFLVNWLPSYLRDERGMTLVTGGMLSAVPFLAADVGNLGGGWLSTRLAQRGVRPSRARFRVMAGCSLLITAGAWVGRANSDVWALVLLATMALGTAAFMANYFACTQEVSARHTGFVVGILGGLANLFVAGFLPFAGYLKDRTGSFGALFLMVGFLPILGAGVLGLGWGEETMEEGSG
jgi:ACS family hexuronate transporter-like MFS transporter